MKAGITLLLALLSTLAIASPAAFTTYKADDKDKLLQESRAAALSLPATLLDLEERSSRALTPNSPAAQKLAREWWQLQMKLNLIEKVYAILLDDSRGHKGQPDCSSTSQPISAMEPRCTRLDSLWTTIKIAKSKTNLNIYQSMRYPEIIVPTIGYERYYRYWPTGPESETAEYNSLFEPRSEILERASLSVENTRQLGQKIDEYLGRRANSTNPLTLELREFRKFLQINYIDENIAIEAGC